MSEHAKVKKDKAEEKADDKYSADRAYVRNAVIASKAELEALKSKVGDLSPDEIFSALEKIIGGVDKVYVPDPEVADEPAE